MRLVGLCINLGRDARGRSSLGPCYFEELITLSQLRISYMASTHYLVLVICQLWDIVIIITSIYEQYIIISKFDSPIIRSENSTPGNWSPYNLFQYNSIHFTLNLIELYCY